MKSTREIGFVVSLLLTGLILHFVNYDERKVALQRADIALRQDIGLQETVALHCGKLTAREDLLVERHFRDRLTPNASRGVVTSCPVIVESSTAHRFFLQSQWNFLLRINSEAGVALAEKSFLVDLPRPLCLLPLAALVLALIFEIRFWGLGWTLGSYLFLLGGGNAIRTVELTARSSWLALQTEQNFLGFLLILLWLALYRSQESVKPVSRTENGIVEGMLNRSLTTLLGLWNPAVFTLGGRLIFPFQGALPRFIAFLDAQFFVLCLSVYLLSLDFKNLKDFVDKSFLLPRYFSFTALLFFAIAYWSSRPRRQTVIWQLPHFWRVAGAIVGMELCALRVPALRQLPTLLRVGLAATVAELAWPVDIRWRHALQLFLPSVAALFTGAFIVIVSQESGVRELAMTILEPRIHPTGLVLFTFLAGLGIGFLTGNFSAAFFTLFTTMGKYSDAPLARAAMLDGILAGCLLSPFSLFNLFPSVQFGVPIQHLISFRFRQLGFPLLIGCTIFTVSAINSVAILQPVTFVFLCLVALAFQLKKSAWSFRRVLT